jgi:hypothetical protein
MLRLFNRQIYAFSNRAFDLAIIGGGPGGTYLDIQDMSLLLKPHNLDSILSASKREAHWEEPA